MKVSRITPKLNQEITEITANRCKEINDFSQETFSRIFNKVIIEKGLSPKSYHEYMRKYF